MTNRVDGTLVGAPQPDVVSEIRLRQGDLTNAPLAVSASTIFRFANRIGSNGFRGWETYLLETLTDE